MYEFPALSFLLTDRLGYQCCMDGSGHSLNKILELTVIT